MTFLCCGRELSKCYTIKFSTTRKACCVVFLNVGETNIVRLLKKPSVTFLALDEL